MERAVQILTPGICDALVPREVSLPHSPAPRGEGCTQFPPESPCVGSDEQPDLDGEGHTVSLKYLCTCQGDTDSEKDLQKETSRRNCTQGFPNPWESTTAKLSSRNPHCNHFTTTLVPYKLALRRSSGCSKLSCLWKCHPPVGSHMKWATFPPSFLLFSQGEEWPWDRAGHVFHIISLRVLRNIFLHPGQGIPPERTVSGLVHTVKSVSLKYKTSKQPPDT